MHNCEMFMKTEEYLVDLHRLSTKEDPVDVGFRKCPHF